MAQYELVLQKDGQSISTYHIGAEGLVLGRASECDVVLPDSLVSRRHARVWIESGQLKVEDLGSRNGISVNGERVVRLRVDEGDQLTVGSHSFQITRATRHKALADTGSMISFEKAGDLFQKMMREPNSNQAPILYKATQLFGTIFDINELLHQLLDLLFEALPIKRGFILTRSSAQAEPIVNASRPADTERGGPPLSQTLIDHVFDNRDAVLTHDAQTEFKGSDSVVNYGITAAMCVPLCGREAVVGVIYADSGDEEILFKAEHLKLLTAIGRVTGVAVENARLHKDAVDRERLAAIGQATAGIGHCIKNILVGIKGGAEFVDLSLETKEIKYIQKGWPLIRRSADRMEDLVLNLVTFSREREPERTPTDVNMLVGEIADTLKIHAERSKVTIDLVRSEVPRIPLDGLGIYRSILNLVTNAIDACEESGGRVTIRTHADARSIYIDVKDTGAGISPEFMPHLFEAFRSTKGSRGTGLGLACSKRIVNEHGGEITVQTKLGKGSKFTIILPARNPDLEKTQGVV
ncbi:MAG: ATP-binding protein [Candidatus Hydrogenedentes bacterium]|nr:ATP-binding protein [Candidatus Hydrogenedentota bacterium]